MMKSLKEELERDLKLVDELITQEQIKLNIEHLKDQMKSVVFLLIRYQEGIEYCQEQMVREKTL